MSVEYLLCLPVPQPLGQSGEALDVGEHDRDDLAGLHRGTDVASVQREILGLKHPVASLVRRTARAVP